MFVCMDVGVAAAYDGFVMVGVMFVCMDEGVAAAYVCFVMEGIMFVCMDVGVAAAYVCFVMERYNVRVHVCRYCRWGHPSIPRREGVLSKRLKHTKYELPPLGEG